jgi:2-dehydro-3-deoxy-D-arabinonate dehydratase
MRIVQFETLNKRLRAGVIEGGMIHDLTNADRKLSSFLEILKESHARKVSVESYVSSLIWKGNLKTYQYDPLADSATNERACLRMPYQPPEVWGCGVTYIRSKQAREIETTTKGIYDKVYEAIRPEVFFKATASRCVGPNEPICIRSDSKWTVPEPELAFIVGMRNDIVGYTIGNDVSARDIEGENPLYLPQAKMYKGSCAFGPVITTPEEIGNPRDLDIECKVFRENECVFEGKTNTSRMRRSVDELRSYLCQDNSIPPGTLCLTGTGVVPPDDLSLRHGDLVEITIEKIDTLQNSVIQL